MTTTANRRFEREVRARVAALSQLPEDYNQLRAAIEVELDVVYAQAEARLTRLANILPACYRGHLERHEDWSVLSDYCADFIEQLANETFARRGQALPQP